MIPVGGGGEGVILLCEADSLLSSHSHSCGRKKIDDDNTFLRENHIHF